LQFGIPWCAPYEETLPRWDTATTLSLVLWECNFVLRDRCDRRLDVHSYELDSDGSNTFGIAYKSEDLQGTGVINGYRVKCISPASLVRFHTGYAVDENDYHDVRLICERFGIPLPDDYSKFA
jgi:lincosamide nucleotidyltransferase A/C/D/E